MSFFGFNTSAPGNGNEDAAPPGAPSGLDDEAQDAFNDETFGDDAEDVTNDFNFSAANAALEGAQRPPAPPAGVLTVDQVQVQMQQSRFMSGVVMADALESQQMRSASTAGPSATPPSTSTKSEVRLDHKVKT